MDLMWCGLTDLTIECDILMVDLRQFLFMEIVICQKAFCEK